MTEAPREDVDKLLLHVEASIHRKGWDQPAFLAMLFWLPGGRLAFAPVPLDLGDPLGAFVDHYGDVMLDESTTAQGLAKIGPQFFGFALVAESYAYEAPSAELFKLYADNVHMGDVPGAKEMRSVSAVDLNGQVYWIQRARGEKPVAFVADQDRHPGGGVYSGLRKMVLSVVNYLPDNEDNLAGLQALAETLAKYDKIMDDGVARASE